MFRFKNIDYEKDTFSQALMKIDSNVYALWKDYKYEGRNKKYNKVYHNKNHGEREFETPYNFTFGSNSLEVYVNRVIQLINVDYIEKGNNKIEFLTDLRVDDEVLIYQYKNW